MTGAGLDLPAVRRSRGPAAQATPEAIWAVGAAAFTLTGCGGDASGSDDTAQTTAATSSRSTATTSSHRWLADALHEPPVMFAGQDPLLCRICPAEVVD